MIGGKGNRERRHTLERSRAINCGRCPYHDGENRGRRLRPDQYKSKRRRGGR